MLISLPRYLSSSVSFGLGTLPGKGRLKTKFSCMLWLTGGCVERGERPRQTDLGKTEASA